MTCSRQKLDTSHPRDGSNFGGTDLAASTSDWKPPASPARHAFVANILLRQVATSGTSKHWSGINVKQPVAFQNSPDVTFAGSLAYLGAIAICSLGILLMCLGYPEWMTIGGLFLASLISVILSHHYLSRSFGSLHIGPQGMEYFPVTGGKASFRWRELAHIKVLPGWLRIYDKQGKKIFSYTYGLGQQHALINVIAKQIGNRKIRPVIWPDVVSAPAAAPKLLRLKRRYGKAKKTLAPQPIKTLKQKKKIATTKVARTRQSRLATSISGNKSRNRKRPPADTSPCADHDSLQRQS